MNTHKIHALEMNDFPFAGGTFSPRYHPVIINLITVQKGKFGACFQTIQTATRLGQDVIPKGAKVSSRLLYIVQNHTKNLQGYVELIGVETSNRTIKFFVSAEILLHSGDEISVKFERIESNSQASGLH